MTQNSKRFFRLSCATFGEEYFSWNVSKSNLFDRLLDPVVVGFTSFQPTIGEYVWLA